MAAIVDDATGMVRTTTALRPTEGAAPVHLTEQQKQQLMAQAQVQTLWQHYQSAKGMLERLLKTAEAAKAAEGEGEVDVHSPYAERALLLLEVLVLRKEKGKGHFSNMTLGSPVIPNNPAYDPTGEGKRRSELPPTEDVAELTRRMLAELEHATRPDVRPGGRAIDVSKAAKALQEALVKARETTPKIKKAAASGGIPATEKTTAAAATGAGALRQRSHHRHRPGHEHKHSGAGSCCPSETGQETAMTVGGRLAMALAWVQAVFSGPERPKEHMHMAGGGCCGKGAAGPSRMGAKQDGHGFLVVVLTCVFALPFVLWMMS